MIWWWLGNLLFLGLVLTAAALAHRVIVEVREIRRYADDIVVHSGGLADTLEPLTALEDTKALIEQVAHRATAYVNKLGAEPAR